MPTIRETLIEIMQLTDIDASDVNGSKMPSGIAHRIYVIARDALDQDRQNMTFYRGHYLSTATIKFLKENLFINAVKQCRTDTGLGLADAKDLCEGYREEMRRGTLG